MQDPDMVPELETELPADLGMEDSGLPDLHGLPDLPGDAPADLGGDVGMDFSGGAENYGGPDRREDTDENAFRRSIYDVPVTVNVSVGRKKLSVAELLKLTPETVIPLTADISDPIDLTIDDRVIARGELIETDEGTLAVRITEIEER